MLYIISNFSTEDGEFHFEQDKLTIDQWLILFNGSIYNEEVCLFREDGMEFMLAVRKPTILVQNLDMNYSVEFFPVSGAYGEELEPEDVTYREIMNWIYDDNDDWIERCQEYVEGYQEFTAIEQLLAKNPKRRYFIVNKYEDLRSYKHELDRHREFPCNFHAFYAKFSKYDIRKVKNLHIQLHFPKTGTTRDFIYTFSEFLDFFSQDEGL